MYLPWRKQWWEHLPSWFSWDSPIHPSHRGTSGAVSSGRRTRTLSCPRSIPHWFPGCYFMNFKSLVSSQNVRKLRFSKHVLMDRKGWPIQPMNIVPHKILHLPHSFWAGYAWPPPTLCWQRCCFRRHQGRPRSPPSCKEQPFWCIYHRQIKSYNTMYQYQTDHRIKHINIINIKSLYAFWKLMMYNDKKFLMNL